MSGLTKWHGLAESSTGRVRVAILAGDVASRDRVTEIDYYGDLPTIEVHALLTKTLNVASAAAAEVHRGYQVTVVLEKLEPR